MYICIHMICSHSNGEFTPVEGNKPISREIHKNNLENTLEKRTTNMIPRQNMVNPNLL